MRRLAAAHTLGLILALTLLASGAPALHEHRAAEPALYDDECSLSLPGASWIEVGLPRAVALVTPLPPVDIALPATPRGSSEAPLLASGPRGPPIAG
jgi:hypothetical protein